MKKMLALIIVLAVTACGTPPVPMIPPAAVPPFMASYFHLEDVVAQMLVDGTITLTEASIINIILDSSYTLYIYSHTEKAAALLEQLSAMLDKMKAAGGSAADAGSARLTLILTFEYTLNCQPFYLAGSSYFKCATPGLPEFLKCDGAWCAPVNN